MLDQDRHRSERPDGEDSPELNEPRVRAGERLLDLVRTRRRGARSPRATPVEASFDVGGRWRRPRESWTLPDSRGAASEALPRSPTPTSSSTRRREASSAIGSSRNVPTRSGLLTTHRGDASVIRLGARRRRRAASTRARRECEAAGRPGPRPEGLQGPPCAPRAGSTAGTRPSSPRRCARRTG